ncbi:hypothetical protein ACU6XY_06715 [Klebsiella aerogenes]|nr:hypothetical protein [Klebsiella aerogenes]HCR0218287.1 hypothetical protein [Klebsiella aerogenes]HCR0959122.1 hypothetical protein [Klebsiella aerogenes]HCT6902892.1 hypothetical protein [Klebsiella aerogenes]HEM8232051.1 hypothetical protein [Klebsiella aerogenes]
MQSPSVGLRRSGVVVFAIVRCTLSPVAGVMPILRNPNKINNFHIIKYIPLPIRVLFVAQDPASVLRIATPIKPNSYNIAT